MSLEEQVQEMDVKTKNSGAAVGTQRVTQTKVAHPEDSLLDTWTLKLLSGLETDRLSGWYQYFFSSSLQGVFLN